MSKRGPKTKITHEMRVAELKNHNIFDDNGKVKKESDPVWIIICNNLNQNDPLRSLTVRNIQTYVAQNRNNVILDIKATLTDSSSNVKPQDQEDNLKFDVEEQLLRIKNDALYKSTVREFCTYPFVLFYWSFEALNLVSLFNDKMFVFGVIGSLSQSFTAPYKSCSKVIFQFTLCSGYVWPFSEI
ncbi:uncharacterized protein LOC107982157 [Nasonia vitripennis]|uniref:Uncharacterized protein n=1 Tax=Nasonia vitripennis TaxID=7425 RepID=A0A7M7PXU3_NASVI|nr:uncharacterized protein LOC107982157 [Nasonia vitripennis]